VKVENLPRYHPGYDPKLDGGYAWACERNKMISKEWPTFAELSVPYPNDKVPFLDQQDVNESSLTPEQRFWRKNGYLILEGFIPPKVVDTYLKTREELQLGRGRFPNTWTPYMQYPVIRDLFCDKRLHYVLVDLIGEELGMHFNLTQFHSTERGWHQDDYLNPPIELRAGYAAVWAAVGDVPEDSGPYEYVPGSHRWNCVSRDLVQQYLDPSVRLGVPPKGQPTWEIYAEQFVNPAYWFEMQRVGARVEKFLAKRGDILIWHAKLVHRGSPPKNREATRPGVIAHYSSVRSARWFGTDVRRHNDGGYYWHF
jgi:hypothetical protein